MPAELATVYVPFRLRNPGGAFTLDTVVGNYDIEVYKAGVLFVPGGGFTITTPGSKLGRHLLSFLGGLEDDYVVYIDYTGGGAFQASIEGGLFTSDRFLSSQLATGARQILMEKIAKNRLETDPVAGTITVYDDDDTTPLLTAPIYEDVAATQPYQGSGIDRRNRMT
jgi:hypothetical protein